MKTAVCVLIMLISTVIGSGLRGDIKRRCESLEALRQICIKLQSEISFRAPPITELIAKYRTDSLCSSLFAEASRNMNDGFKTAWCTSARSWAKASGLSQDETDTVLMLESLGSTDIEGEKQLLSAVAERLSQHTENVRTELKTKGKMYFSCSVLGGLALVIFII